MKLESLAKVSCEKFYCSLQRFFSLFRTDGNMALTSYFLWLKLLYQQLGSSFRFSEASCGHLECLPCFTYKRPCLLKVPGWIAQSQCSSRVMLLIWERRKREHECSIGLLAWSCERLYLLITEEIWKTYSPTAPSEFLYRMSSFRRCGGHHWNESWFCFSTRKT